MKRVPSSERFTLYFLLDLFNCTAGGRAYDRAIHIQTAFHTINLLGNPKNILAQNKLQ